MMKPGTTLSALVGGLLMLTLLSETHAAVVTYNFNALGTGALAASVTPGGAGNQDGWYLDNATPTSVPYVIAATTGSPTTQSWTNSNDSIVRADASRNFGSTFFTGTETNAQYSFTFLYNNKTNFIYMSLGGNGTTPLALNSNNQSNFGPRLVFQSVSSSTGKFGIDGKVSGGSWAGIAYSPAASMTQGHWYTATAIIDFTANSGDGSASVSYADVTANSAPVTALTSVNLGLNFNTTTYAPNKWNQVWFRTNKFDGTGPNLELSSFTVGVPEPATLGLLALGGLMMVNVRGRT